MRASLLLSAPALVFSSLPTSPSIPCFPNRTPEHGVQGDGLEGVVPLHGWSQGGSRGGPGAGRRRVSLGPLPASRQPSPCLHSRFLPSLLLMTLSAVFWLVELWVPLLWLQGKPSFQQGLHSSQGPLTPSLSSYYLWHQKCVLFCVVGGHSPWAPC